VELNHDDSLIVRALELITGEVTRKSLGNVRLASARRPFEDDLFLRLNEELNLFNVLLREIR